MPSKTKRQARAMAVAAHGKSKLGIPRKVAKEFHAADKKTGILKGKRSSRKKKRKGR